MKSRLLQSLHEDHANQLQLLSLIEREIGKLEKDQKTPNFELITLALEYCTDFPGRYHHPKEDLIYAKLLERDPEAGDRAIVLTEEHETLDRLTREFSSAVAEVIAGRPSPSLRETAQNFLRFYRYHIGIEEAEIFPCARKALTDADWEEIENAYLDASDPLFGEHTRKAYIALQRCIVERSRTRPD